MATESSLDLLVLHGVRLIGFADSDDVAAYARIRHADALRLLHDADRAGWVQHSSFADLDGWSLTESGRIENERCLAVERASADPDGVIGRAYEAFVPLNGRLIQAVTDWQMRPTDQDPFALNDHTDDAWDRRILDELTALADDLTPIAARLAGLLTRFTGYEERFRAALAKASTDDTGWVDKTDRDSCHRVWFQLHEDFVATLGVDRGSAPPQM